MNKQKKGGNPDAEKLQGGHQIRVQRGAEAHFSKNWKRKLNGARRLKQYEYI